MSIRILIVEDSEQTGSMLTAYLDAHLASVANSEKCPPAHGGEPGDWAGHLAQLRPFKWEYLHSDFEVRLMPIADVKSLVATASRKEGLEEAVQTTTANAFTRMSGLPDILLVDLALSPPETKRLILSGGNEEPQASSKGQLRDPRSTLETLTGFRILEAFGGKIPVISTSYARNPLVAQHCTMNGAFGVLRKPVVGHHSEVDEEDDHRGWDMATAYDMTLETIQEEGQQNRRALAVVVGHYLSMASAEILKACHFHLLQQGEEEFPDGLSRGFLNDEG